MAKKATDVKGFMAWVDAHPRTGWYIAVLVTLNFVFEVAQIIH